MVNEKGLVGVLTMFTKFT